MVRICDWTVVSSFSGEYTRSFVLPLAVFKSLRDALEYAAFVNQYDQEDYKCWLTYVIEGDLLHTDNLEYAKYLISRFDPRD